MTEPSNEAVEQVNGALRLLDKTRQAFVSEMKEALETDAVGPPPEWDQAVAALQSLRDDTFPAIRNRWEQEVRERLRTPVTELIEYLVYSECARCELVNPERDACQCAVCDRLAELIGNLRSASKALAIFGEAEPVEGEQRG